MADKDIERVNMNWPPGLKARVQEYAGQRGLTEFTTGAVEIRLESEDRALELQREVGELRHLAQLLADRYVMGGDHEDREAFLMEVQLPVWMNTSGWPENLAKQVPKQTLPSPPPAPAPEVASGEHVPSPPPPIVGQSRPEGETSEEWTAEDRRPMFLSGAPKADESSASPEVVETSEMSTPKGSDMFERLKAKAAEKGVDVTGAGLVPASSLPVPADNPHNHAWAKDEAEVYRCSCSAWIDNSDPAYPQGIVRDDPTLIDPNHPNYQGGEASVAEPATQEPVPLAVPVAPATPLEPEQTRILTRDLSDVDVDF